MNMRNFSEFMRKRHRNPWSGWTRALLTFPLIHAVWMNNLIYCGMVLLLLISNPFWFKPIEDTPKNLNFMTKVVDGEWIFMQENKNNLLSLMLLKLPGVLGVYWIYTLWMNQLVPSIFVGSFLIIHKIIFVIWVSKMPKYNS